MWVVFAVEGLHFVADPDPEGELDDVRVRARTRESEVPCRLFVSHVRKQLHLVGKFGSIFFGGNLNAVPNAWVSQAQVRSVVGGCSSTVILGFSVRKVSNEVEDQTNFKTRIQINSKNQEH